MLTHVILGMCAGSRAPRRVALPPQIPPSRAKFRTAQDLCDGRGVAGEGTPKSHLRIGESVKKITLSKSGTQRSKRERDT